MAESTINFDDSAAYERMMAGWSRTVGRQFLQWLSPQQQARWLEVGCGTGVFTQLVVDTCAPGSVVAVDSSEAQIRHACRQPLAERVQFRVADARSLPFEAGDFDIVASALVINFVPDRVRGLSEMRRVARAGGMVAGYVWDFAAERSPTWPVRAAMRKFGMDVPVIPGTRDSSLDALEALLNGAGFVEVVARSIEATESFPDFDSLWRAQTPSFIPTAKMILALPESEQRKLKEILRAGLPRSPEGTIQYTARANAIKARVP